VNAEPGFDEAVDYVQEPASPTNVSFCAIYYNLLVKMPITYYIFYFSTACLAIYQLLRPLFIGLLQMMKENT